MSPFGDCTNTKACVSVTKQHYELFYHHKTSHNNNPMVLNCGSRSATAIAAQGILTLRNGITQLQPHQPHFPANCMQCKGFLAHRNLKPETHQFGF